MEDSQLKNRFCSKIYQKYERSANITEKKKKVEKEKNGESEKIIIRIQTWEKIRIKQEIERITSQRIPEEKRIKWERKVIEKEKARWNIRIPQEIQIEASKLYCVFRKI